jgi:hypothetical protein
MNSQAFTLIELMMAVAFSVILMTGVYSFYNTAQQVYSGGITGQTLQTGVNVIISKIIEGGTEPGGSVFRLATAYSFYIPNGNANTIYFCQDSPCSAADATARWYTLDPTNTEVLYHHPTSNPLGYDIIYAAPTGSSFFNSATNSKTLRFSPAQFGNPPQPSSNVVEIDVALIENSTPGGTNNRLANGNASTYVLLRNHT